MGATTDPPKPGSKLAQMQALGRRGGVRYGEPAVSQSSKDAAVKVRRARTAMARVATKKPTKKAAKKTATRAKRPAKQPIRKAAAKKTAARKKKLEPKRGRPSLTGKPWEQEGVSRRTWERRRKQPETTNEPRRDDPIEGDPPAEADDAA